MTEQQAGAPTADDIEDDAPPGVGERVASAFAAIGRMLAALFLPDRGMPAVVSRGSVGLPIAAATLCALLAAAAIGSRIDVAPDVLAKAAAAAAPRPGQSGPAPETKSDRQVQEEIEKTLSMKRVTLALGAGIGTPARILGFAFLLLLALRYAGGKINASRALSLSAHAALPFAVAALIIAASAWSQEAITPAQVEGLLPNPVVPALADQGPLLSRVAHGLSPFSIWSLILVGFGASAAAEISRRRAVITVAVSFVLYLLVFEVIMGAKS